MVRGQRRWWREMIYQHGDGQDRAVLLKQTPPGFLGSLNFANAVCVRSLEMGWVGTWPSSLQARSLCEWLFRGALTCAGIGESASVSPPASSPGPAGSAWVQLEQGAPMGAAEKSVSPCSGTWSWEPASGIAVSSCQGLV